MLSIDVYWLGVAYVGGIALTSLTIIGFVDLWQKSRAKARKVQNRIRRY